MLRELAHPSFCLTSLSDHCLQQHNSFTTEQSDIDHPSHPSYLTIAQKPIPKRGGQQEKREKEQQTEKESKIQILQIPIPSTSIIFTNNEHL